MSESPGGTGGTSPLDEPRDGGPTGREATPSEPEAPGEEPGGDQPAGEEPRGARPDGDQGSDDPGQNRPASPDDHPRGSAVPVDPDAERWGDLPPRYREVFRRAGADDLPVQYRDWIDAYYRKLSRER